MRRETDFVLEKAAWPTLLLESGGRICRANQVSRTVLALGDDSSRTTLSSVWDERNTASADKFLQEQNQESTTQIRVRLNNGQTAPFIAHVAKVARDGQDYFLLQLFKESGGSFPEVAPAPPIAAPVPKAGTSRSEKTTIIGAFQNADWPAIITDRQGLIINANEAAVSKFGEKVVGKGSAASALCADGETASMGKLLTQPPQSLSTPLKISLADGKSAAFRIESCPAGDGKWMILQFFTYIEPVAVPPPPPVALPPTPPPKPVEEEFLLQNAEWPVLLVRKDGKLLKANRAGIRSFGPQVEKDDAQLADIWSPDNRGTFQQFLAIAPAGEPVPIKLKLASGMAEDFAGQLSPAGREDIYVLQLLKAPPAPPETAVEPKETESAPTSAATVSGPPAAASAGVEVNLAHKQKLDCALQLARSVALDFNNALTSILGHASLLLSKSEANHPWRSSLGEIEKSAAKAAEIANDLAAFSRQEKDVRGQVAGNVNQLLERTVEMFQSSLPGAITMSKQLERKLFTANFDEAKLQQALVKIFENAVESITGSGKISVQTKNLELTEATQDRTAKLNPGNYVCVEISDTGAGIADDVMPRIFEPFFTTKGQGHRGLGLAWVYGIVTNHGGGVAVSSQVDIGTSVRLYLPGTGKIVKDTAVADGDLNGTETILLVDDEDLLLTMGRMVLSSYGYTVLTANSGQKALELFTKSKKKIDLVITDLVMPAMSGRELGEHILKAAPGTRIMWCSGYVRSANAQEQERYLQKPFSSQDLLRKVKQVLAQ
jgi:signal transduction histidine kinase